jgi:hypothetical protein
VHSKDGEEKAKRKTFIGESGFVSSFQNYWCSGHENVNIKLNLTEN